MTESPLKNKTDQSKWWASPAHRDLDAIDDLDYHYLVEQHDSMTVQLNLQDWLRNRRGS